jgi:putative transposase
MKPHHERSPESRPVGAGLQPAQFRAALATRRLGRSNPDSAGYKPAATGRSAKALTQARLRELAETRPCFCPPIPIRYMRPPLLLEAAAMPEVFRRRTLPHWDLDDSIYFITTCLAGSTPARGHTASRRKPTTPSPHMSPPMRRSRQEALRFAAHDAWLDQNRRVRWLADPRLADIVTDAVHFGAGTRYDLFAFVVMPNHVHLVIRPLAGPAPCESTRARVLSSFKRHTARRCNQILGRRGAFWQDEAYDRIVRSQAELQRIVHYVEANPVRAGLCSRIEEWPYSSAAARA